MYGEGVGFRDTECVCVCVCTCVCVHVHGHACRTHTHARTHTNTHTHTHTPSYAETIFDVFLIFSMGTQPGDDMRKVGAIFQVQFLKSALFSVLY